jgi:hypothetical protein
MVRDDQLKMVMDVVRCTEDVYASALQNAANGRQRLREILIGKWLTFDAEIETYPKRVWGIAKGIVNQVYIERKRIRIEVWTWDEQGKKRTYTHAVSPRQIKTISETEPSL